ncbi:hypothetical protein SAMN06269117_11460 [Balnearium lithotrophicum]|uniref:Uncharacterized protein n=1 Tax=Balnearium lithotrophicum TaxID=223788 RepID=A0A521CRC3_9BACT|nr:phage tail tube protein [Balnearium lithotrophicum]SMO61958.1 hypothetical protein SAMN06269117_11460 [Balnearium lithotrophicum]
MRASRKTVVLAKIEDTYGVDALPDPTNDAIQVVSADPSPDYKFLENNELSPTLSRRPGMSAGGTWKIDIKVKLRGSGDKTKEPRIGRLIEACSFKKEVLDSDGDGYTDTYKYTPISSLDSQKSLTIYLYKDGELYKFVGCKGDISLDAEVREFSEVTFSFVGKLLERVEAPVPDVTYEVTKPVVFKDAMCKIDDTFAPRFSKVSIGLNNTITAVDDANSSDGIWKVFITDRKPSGSFDPLATLPSEYDFLTKFENGDVATLNFTLGQEEGNKVVVTSKIQFSDYKFSDKDGVLTNDMTFNLVTENGDDELIIEFK